MLAAPTGKAAFLIIGNTMHGLFQIPANGMLQYIHQRLQQITGSRKHIAGISILAVGDLFQLKPVFNGWIFENLKDDYGPLALNIWRDNFQVYNLNEIMRKKINKNNLHVF